MIAMGAMKGGGKLEAFLRDMERKISRPAVLKVGFMEDAKEPDGTPTAMVAAINNFGAPAVGIPPRPFFSTMISKNQASWPAQLAGCLKARDMDATAALEDMGGIIAGELRTEITLMDSPPLSPVTLMLRSMRIGKRDEPVTFAMVQEARARVALGEQPKGLTATGAKPLVDSGTMLNRIESVVES